MWTTNRSAYERGLKHCGGARYLGYHAGPAQQGIAPNYGSVPLITGQQVHAVLASILLREKLLNSPVDDVQLRAIIKAAQEEYRKLATAGLVGVEAGPAVEETIAEQCALVEALSWCWFIHLLPFVRENFRILDVEQEDFIILGCTCGLGNDLRELDNHDLRNCEGILWLTRADFTTERISDGEVGIHDFKSTGRVDEVWRRGWYDNIQMAAQCLAVEKRLHRPVNHYYIHGLIKGYRKRLFDKPFDKPPKYQDSLLVRGYYKAAKPPLEAADWKPQYEWEEVDEQGSTRTRRLGKGYEKRPVWNATFEGKPAEMSSVEYWVKWLPPEVSSAQITFLGPYDRPDQLIEEWRKEVVVEEYRWHWLHDTYSGSLDPLTNGSIPRSWNCESYYGERCAFFAVCKKQGNWQDPLAAKEYVERQPHHQLDELVQE